MLARVDAVFSQAVAQLERRFAIDVGVWTNGPPSSRIRVGVVNLGRDRR